MCVYLPMYLHEGTVCELAQKFLCTYLWRLEDTFNYHPQKHYSLLQDSLFLAWSSSVWLG